MEPGPATPGAVGGGPARRPRSWRLLRWARSALSLHVHGVHVPGAGGVDHRLLPGPQARRTGQRGDRGGHGIRDDRVRLLGGLATPDRPGAELMPQRMVSRILVTLAGHEVDEETIRLACRMATRRRAEGKEPAKIRSEEHTSELQSQSNLVCRLL